MRGTAMVLMMKLKHVDELPGGRKRFRRRYPKVVVATIGEEFFQVSMKARQGADLVTEHETLMREYEKLVSKAMRRAAGQGQLSPLEHWREAVKEAEAMVAAMSGGTSEDDRRDILADDLRHRGADPILYRAVMMPDVEAPEVTMLDAKEIYRKERMNGAVGRNQANRLLVHLDRLAVRRCATRGRAQNFRLGQNPGPVAIAQFSVGRRAHAITWSGRWAPCRTGSSRSWWSR
jgi:hypothetical protein